VTGICYRTEIMNTTILNRSYLHPADGWYHIEPKGEHPNPAAKVVQVIDDDACREIVQRFNQDADAGQLSHGQEMLIDHEHFRHDQGKETIAYGWLQRLESRSDGIYGKVRWSATGQKAVDGGDYRFFSTEYDPADLKVVTSQSGTPLPADAPQATPCPSVRPLRLDGLTLTNDPNNRGARPITNRTPPRGIPDSQLAEAGALAVIQPKNKNRQTNRNMKNIATILGLAAEASEEAILAEVTRLQNRVTTLEPLDNENVKLQNRLKELDAANVDALLAGHGVKDAKILNRMKPVLLGMSADQRQGFLDECLPPAAAPAPVAPTVSPQVKLHNRDTRPPAGGRQFVGDAPAANPAKALKIINRARQIKKETPTLSDATAVLMAQREVEAAE